MNTRPQRQASLLAAFLLCALPALWAQNAPKFSNEFLTLGVGARAQGMSNSVVAHVADGTAGYWNPAGLTRLEVPFQVNAMHAEWFGGIAKYDYISIAKPLNNARKAAVAVSLIRLGIDNIPNTLRLIDDDGTVNYDNVTEFSAADYAGLFSYAQNLGVAGLSVGGNVKVVRRVAGTFANAWGFGLDLGAQYQRGAWQFGLVARDVTSTFNAWSFSFTEEEKAIFNQTGNDIPANSVEITLPQFWTGAAYKVDFSRKFGLLAELDLQAYTDGQRNVLISSRAINLQPSLGTELHYDRRIFLRAGLGQFQQVKDDFDPEQTRWTMQPNFGVGLKLGRLHVDYALTNIGNVAAAQYSHIFSLALDFERKTRE